MKHDVTQADRDAAARQTIWSNEQRRDVSSGKLDHNPNVQAFAAHRIAATQEAEWRIVEWRDFHKDPPESGMKVAIVCDDGCSIGLAYITDEGALDGEWGDPLGVTFLQGAIWMALPDNYPIAFMEAHDDY